MNSLIRTLVVDDSAFVRKVVREMLSRSPHIEVVGVARDGQEALEMAEQLKPQVITCDLNMPHMDGVGFVRQQMARRPIPILLLTASPQDGDRALEAIEAGAIDFLQKPSALANEDILKIREDLLEKVKAACSAPVARIPSTNGKIAPLRARPLIRARTNFDVIVIGISTGGPQALRQFIPKFPADLPVPIVIVLHMPVGYTNLYAQKLNELCELEVIEARDGAAVRPGTAIIAQAGRHVALQRAASGEIVTHLTLKPMDLVHRPAADVLFRSAAELFGRRTLGVVMTGMGNDGAEGAAWIKAQGGAVLTEAEESCIIYGMPRSVVEAGLSDFQIPLSRMAEAIVERL